VASAWSVVALTTLRSFECAHFASRCYCPGSDTDAAIVTGATDVALLASLALKCALRPQAWLRAVEEGARSEASAGDG
jgi:hypothetical protein